MEFCSHAYASACALIAELCQGHGLPPPQPGADEGGIRFCIEVDGVDVEIVHDPAGDPDAIGLSVCFGAIPDDRKLEVMEGLLRLNCVLDSVASRFGVSADTQVWFMVRVALQALTSEMLAGRIHGLVQLAAQWQQGDLLHEVGEIIQPTPSSSVFPGEQSGFVHFGAPAREFL